MNAIQVNAKRWVESGHYEICSNAELCLQAELRKAGYILPHVTIETVDFHNENAIIVETSDGAEFTINFNSGHINQC